MKKMRTLVSSGLFFGLAVFGWAQGSDNFTGTSVNSTNWPGGYMFGQGSGTLSQNGTLRFSSSTGTDNYAAWGWSGRPTYATSWSAQVDVLVPNLALYASNQDYSVGFYIEGGPGGPISSYHMDGTLAPLYTTALEYRYNSEVVTNNISLFHVEPVVSTAITSAALMIDFNSTSKMLTTYYDNDGAVGGYNWTTLLAYDASGWGMSSSDVFSIQLVGSSNNFAISTGDGLAMDNFSTSVSAVPEPSTYAAIFGAIVLAGAVIRRRRQAA